ncbi:galactokinase [Striga asiatica]|uniref:Galactokinase n=1 Tax=Striga asiatica TaxID=4170 RepID=A0A5A7Q745_STRAF|nr:galactokinase [Striga asiatica]
METQIGPYFFFASEVPGLGSAAIATFAAEHTAAAATANIRSLRPLILPSSALFTAVFSSEPLDEARTATMPRREVVERFLAAELPKKEAVMDLYLCRVSAGIEVAFVVDTPKPERVLSRQNGSNIDHNHGLVFIHHDLRKLLEGDDFERRALFRIVRDLDLNNLGWIRLQHAETWSG